MLKKVLDGDFFYNFNIRYKNIFSSIKKKILNRYFNVYFIIWFGAAKSIHTYLYKNKILGDKGI